MVQRIASLDQGLAPHGHFLVLVQVDFEQNENMGKIVGTGVNDNKVQTPKGIVSVQCFPLYTYLLALNLTHVDYFSLDVEGVELDVLKTIPFHSVSIQVSRYMAGGAATKARIYGVKRRLQAPSLQARLHPAWQGQENTMFTIEY